jgi:hypothetical protein
VARAAKRAPADEARPAAVHASHGRRAIASGEVPGLEVTSVTVLPAYQEPEGDGVHEGMAADVGYARHAECRQARDTRQPARIRAPSTRGRWFRGWIRVTRAIQLRFGGGEALRPDFRARKARHTRNRPQICGGGRPRSLFASGWRATRDVSEGATRLAAELALTCGMETGQQYVHRGVTLPDDAFLRTRSMRVPRAIQHDLRL